MKLILGIILVVIFAVFSNLGRKKRREYLELRRKLVRRAKGYGDSEKERPLRGRESDEQ